MDVLLQVFLICLVLGAIVGFSAGLLGIGGGLLIVPALLYILPKLGVVSEQLPHIAIATSLAAIILTSISSASAHQKRKNINWSVCYRIIPGVLFGAVLAGFIADFIPAEHLQKAFALFVILMAAQMAYPLKLEPTRVLPATPQLFFSAIIIAVIASLMGIGGGVLLVPFLSFYSMPMRNAVGVSSVMGVFIALFGSLGYIIAGWGTQGLPEWTLGYVYLPALFGIVITSVLMAPVGVKAASMWSTPLLKKIFSVLLLGIGLKLVF